MTPAEMDAAAEEAQREFDAAYNNDAIGAEGARTWTAHELCEWFKKWLPKAGHKRLGRIIVGKIK